MQHRSCCTNNSPVLPLSNPILLGLLRNGQLSPDTLLGAKVSKLSGGILTLIVRPQYLDLSPCLVLYKSLELLEPFEDLTLGFQEIDPGPRGEVINECHSHPPKETDDMGPHTLECTKSSMSTNLLSLLEKTVLVYFPRAHPLHTS